MARVVASGEQDFEEIILNDYFYVDKTNFIKEWRESGFGRHDVMLKPKGLKEKSTSAIFVEFKVCNPKHEKNLEETVEAALMQIREKGDASALITQGIPEENIRGYGFAFEGENVLIGGGA